MGVGPRKLTSRRGPFHETRKARWRARAMLKMVVIIIGSLVGGMALGIGFFFAVSTVLGTLAERALG